MSSNRPGRPMSPIDSQMDLIKPYITRATATSPKRHTDQHTFILGKPAEWTKGAKCITSPKYFDDPVGLKDGQAAQRCAGCPVIEQCLAAAMTEEHGLSAGSRYTIRGGLSPKERADMAFADRECDRGHKGRWESIGVCGHCRAEDKRELYQRQRQDPEYIARRLAASRESRSVRTISCLECKSEMRLSNFNRHLARAHGGEERAA